MAQPAAIDPSLPTDQQSRTDLTLARIGQAWAYAAKGKEFTAALIDFLRSLSTQATLRSYSFSILEFFDWYQRRFGRLVTPAAVRRADAVEYAKWLRTHQTGLQKWQLEHDPERRLALAIFDIVAANPGADIAAIRGALLRFSQFTVFHEGRVVLAIEHPDAWGKTGGLPRRLACLVKYRTLTRTPTVAQLRRGEPELELEFADGRPVPASQLGIAVEIPPEVFNYFVPRVATPEGPDRASTVATRLSALSSFWEYLGRSGENLGSSEPLIKHNIWSPALKEAARQAPSHQAATRARKTPSFGLFMRLLATTFYHSHGRGPAALAAAEASFWGRQVPPAERVARLSDLRDRALLLFMSQTGARAKEVGRLKRSDVAGTPPVVSILGKRGKRRALRLPPPAERALVDLFRRIQQISKSDTDRGFRAQELLKAESPLLPAVAYWGANDWKSSDETGLTRPGIAMVLRRRAERAGIEPGSPDFARAHPHGLRHLFAKFAADTGTPMHRIQAMMGHSSAATTGRYMEERDPEKLVVEALVSSAEVPGARLAEHPLPGPRVRSEVPSIEPPSLRPPRVRKGIPAVPLAPPSPATLPLPAPSKRWCWRSK